MKAFLLSVHVLAAIVLIGPITAAASVFPRYARVAAGARSYPAADPAADPAAAAALPVAAAMHRISRGYAVPAVAVPVFGIGTATAMGVLGDAWLIASMVLTAAAALLLVGRINPVQRRVLDGLRSGTTPGAVLSDVRRLGMVTGVFALLWAIVVVLMIVRPGSTTGV